MKLVVIYRPESERARDLEAYVRDLKPVLPRNVKIEFVGVDTRDGVTTASLYDVLDYPGLVVTTDDGVMIHSWSGPPLPRANEVMAYFLRA